jgi:hypothetical protein
VAPLHHYTALTAIGDVTGDGRNDVLGRTGDGRLWAIPGDGRGALGTRIAVGSGWNVFSTILL